MQQPLRGWSELVEAVVAQRAFELMGPRVQALPVLARRKALQNADVLVDAGQEFRDHLTHDRMNGER